MGLSATQARYLMLTGRQSDLEYQGQQINNERTVLSQQVSELYNSLLSMDVPTPPSTTDYQTVKYSGTVGATTYSFDASSVKPTADSTYTIKIGKEAYGNNLNESTVNSIGIENTTVYMVGLGTVGEGESATQQELYYNTSDEKWYTDKDYNNEYEGTVEMYEVYTKGSQKYYWDGADEVECVETPTYSVSMPCKKVAGNNAYKLTDGNGNYNQETAARLDLDQDTMEAYINAVINANIKNNSGVAYTADDFDIFITTGDSATDTTIRFVLDKDFTSETTSAQTYSYVANGKYTNYEEVTGCKLTFDSSTGRILTLEKPIKDASSIITGYTSISLSSSTETDEYAYKDAYAQYEYKKYQYDKEQQEINAKTSIIQQEDRNLELKLQRLDTERQEITTEVDSLKEVLKNNIEGSYKTFSG